MKKLNFEIITLPPHFNSISTALTNLFGSSVSLVKKTRISGGDINQSYALTLNNGECVFMKSNANTPADFFHAEATGLSAIASTHAIKAPEILCTGTDSSGDIPYNFLLLKYIENGNPRTDYWETFAKNLSDMHNANTKDFFENDYSENNASKNQFGFFQNNYIGETRQINTPHESWISFFRDERLVPQFKKLTYILMMSREKRSQSFWTTWMIF